MKATTGKRLGKFFAAAEECGENRGSYHDPRASVLCPNYVQIIFELCLNYVQIIFELCPNYVQIVFKSCSNYV